ncbi:hypothetical protein Tco_0711791 [Tanacetum coccineum]
MDSQYFKDKALRWEAKEKGDASNTTNMFQANHEDAYDSDVDEGPKCCLSLSWPNFEEHLDSDAETEIDDNTIPYHQYLLDTEAQNVPTEEQALVIQRNKRNAELVQENDLLKSTLSGKEKSIAFLQSEKEKILSEKKDLADSYLDEIVSSNALTCTRDLLGTRNPGLGYIAKRAQPVLYDADTLLHPAHHPVRIWDSEDVLVHQVVSMKKMSEKPGHVRPRKTVSNDKLNAMIVCSSEELFPRTQGVGCAPASNCLCKDLESACDREHTKVLELEAWNFKGKDDTLSEFRCSDQLMKVLNVKVPLKLDGLKVENVSLKRRYDELSKANTHSRTAYTEKLNALTAENAKLKTEPSGKKSSGSTASENPNTCFWMYRTNSSKSKGRTVADSIAERLTRPTAYKFKTDCSIIPVWVF